MVPPNNRELTDHPSSSSERIVVIPSGEKWQQCEASLPLLTSPKVKNYGVIPAFSHTPLCGGGNCTQTTLPFLSTAVYILSLYLSSAWDYKSIA